MSIDASERAHEIYILEQQIKNLKETIKDNMDITFYMVRMLSEEINKINYPLDLHNVSIMPDGRVRKTPTQKQRNMTT